MRWWKYIFNLEVIGTLLVVIAVIYFASTTKRKNKYDYQGLGESGWDVRAGGVYVPPTRKKRKRRKINRHEERCREIFQGLFGHRFKSVRPDWLKNPVTGKNLELDGFCSKIRTPIGVGLAFEYDGEQHAKYNKHFHNGNPDAFRYQVQRDKWKDIKCKEHRVLLIRIPHNVAFYDLERYIRQQLRKHNLNPMGHVSRSAQVPRSTGFLAGLYG